MVLDQNQDWFNELLLFKHTNVGRIKNNLSSLFSQKKASFTLYDLPGHESIRYKYLEDFKHNARAIIFVVDSATFQANQKDVAEFLFRIFTDKSIAKSSPAICVACNKQGTNFVLRFSFVYAHAPSIRHLYDHTNAKHLFWVLFANLSVRLDHLNG